MHSTVPKPHTKHKREKREKKQNTSRNSFFKSLIARLDMSKWSNTLFSRCLDICALKIDFLHPRPLKVQSSVIKEHVDVKCSYFFVVFLFLFFSQKEEVVTFFDGGWSGWVREWVLTSNSPTVPFHKHLEGLKMLFSYVRML